MPFPQESGPIGVVAHARSRFKRLGELSRLAAGSGGRIRLALTQSVDELPETLRQLIGTEGCSVLGIVGGDGSIHRAVNALAPLLRGDGSATVEAPSLLLLRGGSMNMLARALRIGGNPMGNLPRVLAAKPGDWKGVDVPLLQVNCAQQRVDVPTDLSSTDPRGDVPLPIIGSAARNVVLGFVFGSALTARCLELHEQRFGGGDLGLVRFLGAVGTGAVFGTQFWKEQHPWLMGSSTPLVADGRPIPYLAAVGATVDVQLFGGWVTGLRAGRGQSGRFPLRVLHKMSPGAVARRLPDLLLGRRAAGIEDLESVQLVELRGDFSLDGEVYRQVGEPALRISSPPWTLKFLVPTR